jgi:sporulation protein YlmC with PRC-barrel domain
MIAAELRGGDKPSLNEALGWIGSRVDDLYGVPIGRLEDVWIDPATGEPRWLLVKEGRFGGRSTLVPFDDATPGEGAVWIPYERDIVREAPQVEPAVPLTQQLEATLRDHYAANAAAAVSHGARTSGPTPEPDDNGAPGATVRLRAPDTGPEPVPPPRLPERPPPPVTPPPAGEERFPFPPPRPPAEEAAAPRQRFEDEPPAAAPAQPPQPSAQPYRPPAQPQRDEPPAPDPLAALAGLPPGHVVEIELAGGVKITGELRRVRIVPGERES